MAQSSTSPTIKYEISRAPCQATSYPRSRCDRSSIRASLREIYLDFDDCVLWEAYQWVQRPAAMAWFWAPVRRHPVPVPGCEALYFANTTIESDSGPVEICAHAGLLASHAILDAESASPGA